MLLDGDTLNRLRAAIERVASKQAAGVEIVLDSGSSKSRLLELLQQVSETVEGDAIARNTTLTFEAPTGPFNSDERTIGLWHFDESSGSTVADSSSNGNNLTVVGGTWTTGRWNNGLLLDGSSSYCYGELSYTERLGHYVYFGGWFNPSGDGPLIHWPGLMTLYISAGRLMVDIGASTYQGPPVDTGNWQYLHCQFFDGRVYIGVNDVFMWHDHPAEEISTSFNTFYIGYDGSSYWAGTVDEVIVAADVLVEEDKIFPRNWAHPAAYGIWQFGEGAGNYAFNTLLTYRPLTLVNHTWTSGYIGNAVSFNADGYATLTTDDESLTSFGIELCLQFDDTSSTQVLLYMDGVLQVSWQPGQLNVTFNDLTPSTFTFELPTINSTEWYVLSVQYDNGTVSAWLNGLKMGEADATGNISLGGNNLLIGGDGSSGLIGKLDYVRVYRSPVRPYYRPIKRWLIGDGGFENHEDWILF